MLLVAVVAKIGEEERTGQQKKSHLKIQMCDLAAGLRKGQRLEEEEPEQVAEEAVRSTRSSTLPRTYPGISH